MTDEQIVRTLAEFEGWTGVDDRGWGQWKDGIVKHVPPYLTSYDAVARVCQKLGDAPYIITVGMSLWFRLKPRDIAEALARAVVATSAIVASKESNNG